MSEPSEELLIPPLAPAGDPSPRRRNRLATSGFAPRSTFASLSIRNFRLFFWGQTLSICGTWMQTVGQGWLVLDLSHSGTVLGLVTSARFLPILLFGAWGGVVADRCDKRRLLLVTQFVSACLAAILAIVVTTGQVRLWMVYVLALSLGTTNVFDQPARQSFVSELVPETHLVNAVTLASLTANFGRVIGPALAGLTIATLGLGTCFIVNAISFVPVVLSLLAMDSTAFDRTPPVARSPGQLRAGLSYARRAPALAVPLAMVAAVGTLTWQFPITLPLMADGPFRGGAGTYGAMLTAMGGGAVLGGLVGAARISVRPVVLSRSALAWGISIGCAVLAPNLGWEIVALIVVGYCSVTFNSLAKTILQLGAEPQMRGRVMALWAVAWQGPSPLGGPIVGFVGEAAGARWALALGSLAAIASGLFSYRRLARTKPGIVASP